MKYNKAYEKEGKFEDYLTYLESIKQKLPKDVFDFVSDFNRHNFSEQSLHDGWIKSFECCSDFEAGTTDITLSLLGAYFDREFKFYFKKVSQYAISQHISDMDRDLITFEIGLEENEEEEDALVFRAKFSGEETYIEIYFQKIQIDEHLK